MDSDIFDRVEKPSGAKYLLFRWAVLLSVLLIELLWLTTQFDTQSLAESTQSWAKLLGLAPILLNMSLAFVAVFILITGTRLKHIIYNALVQPQHHRWWLWLALHFAAFIAFVALTAFLFETEIDAILYPEAWLTGWLVLGATILVLWLFSLAPPHLWIELARRERVAVVLASLGAVVLWTMGQITKEFWHPLANATFLLSRQLLGLVYPDVISDVSNRTLGTTAFQVVISPECSGYEGIGLVTGFLALYLWMFRNQLRFPNALSLLPIGALVIWLVNAIRITMLIVIGTSFSPAVAAGGFHSQAGWITFLIVALGLVALVHQMRFFGVGKSVVSAPVAEHAQLAEAMLVPLLVLLATIMLTDAFTSGFDWLYPVRVAVTFAVLWYFRKVYVKLDLRWSWHSIPIGVAVFLIWIVLEPPVDHKNTDLAQGLNNLSDPAATLWLTFRIIGSVLLVPVVEELAFRGYLIRKLIARNFEKVPVGQFTWLSFIISSMLFGILHGRWLAGTLAGMAYALALYRKGRLVDAVVAHMATNALIAGHVIINGAWSLWS